ncbi:hypothetical protein SK128_022525, partial [Halocaridina rubra]
MPGVVCLFKRPAHLRSMHSNHDHSSPTPASPAPPSLTLKSTAHIPVPACLLST